MTKSILGLLTLANARALTIHSLSFQLFSGSPLSIYTKVYSPSNPTLIIVSATVYLLTNPSLNNLVNIGRVKSATHPPNYATAVQAAALTFQYESFKADINTFLAL